MNPTFLRTSQRSRVENSKCLLYYATFFIFLITVTASVETTNKTLDCIDYYNLTSPNYPSNYPNDASAEWYITAPSHMRILVTFHSFNLETRDDVEIMDMVNAHQRKRYSGENMHFHPYLTKGYSVKITFTSSEKNRRTGFNISVSCYEISKNVPARLVPGTSPGEGFLELPSQSGHAGEWKRVCEDSSSDTLADVICEELGYPGVKEVTNVEECLLDHLNETCRPIRGPTCQDNTYRLEDCQPDQSPCSSHNVVKINCYEPGYLGCFVKSETMNLQDGLPFISTARCISSCKSDDIQAVAIMNHDECFCTTYAEAQLEDASKCGEETEDISRMSVYSASVGFCKDFNDTTGGSWHSDSTWFGSTANLTCMDGYTLNGSGTLQCVPGVTPYYPEWNYSFASCIMDDGTTPPANLDAVKIIIVTFTIAVIILIVIVYVIYYRRTGKYPWKSRSEHSPGHTNDGQSTFSNNRSGGETPSNRPSGGPRSSTGRLSNGSRGNTWIPTIPISVIPPVLPNNVPQDIQPPAPPSSQPSNTSDIPLTMLQNHPRTQNHYVSSNSYPNPYYYASSTDTQRLVSTGLEEAYQEPSSMDMVNHSYEDTGDGRGQSNATLQTEHTSATELSMISRPLPHRPFSSNCNEGPTLPPRDTSLHSKKRTLVAVSLRQRKSKTVNENNNLPLGACASEYNVIQDLPNMQLHGTSCKQPGQPSETRFYHTLEDEEHGNLRQDRHNREAPTSGAPRGNTPDPFYHLLENDASGSDSGNNNHLLYHTPHHAPDRTDRTESTMMIDNILYTPLKSSSRK